MFSSGWVLSTTWCKQATFWFNFLDGLVSRLVNILLVTFRTIDISMLQLWIEGNFKWNNLDVLCHVNCEKYLSCEEKNQYFSTRYTKLFRKSNLFFFFLSFCFTFACSFTSRLFCMRFGCSFDKISFITLCQGWGLGQPLDEWWMFSINPSPFLKGKRKGIREMDLWVGKEN